MLRILILQNLVPHYRRPVYNELSKYYDVTVLHSGKRSTGVHDLYKEIVVPTFNIGPFIIQSGALQKSISGPYDVVIAMADLHWVINMMLPFILKKKRLLLWGHRYSNQTIIDKIKDIIMMHSDGVILYTCSEVSKMIARGIPAAEIFLAQNTLHIPNHSDGSGLVKDSFIFTGRAQERKKVNILIKAFSDICNHIPDNVIINIVGAGAENDKLKSLALTSGVADRVIFHNEVNDHKLLKQLFQKAFAYVSPGPVGLGVLHSFAYGTPVVTAKSEKHGPEFDNLFNDENSIIYNTFDELKETLIRLCNENGLATRLGGNAYKKYHDERTLDKMITGFRQAIENKNG